MTTTRPARMHRRLPITTETAEVVMAWERHRSQLPTPPAIRHWLFPSPQLRAKQAHGHVTAVCVGGALERLDAADRPDRRRAPRSRRAAPFDRSRVTPPALRHNLRHRAGQRRGVAAGSDGAARARLGRYEPCAAPDCSNATVRPAGPNTNAPSTWPRATSVRCPPAGRWHLNSRARRKAHSGRDVPEQRHQSLQRHPGVDQRGGVGYYAARVGSRGTGRTGPLVDSEELAVDPVDPPHPGVPTPRLRRRPSHARGPAWHATAGSGTASGGSLVGWAAASGDVPRPSRLRRSRW